MYNVLLDIDFTKSSPIEEISHNSVTMRNASYDGAKGAWLINENKSGTWSGPYVQLNEYQKNIFKYPEHITYKLTMDIEFISEGSISSEKYMPIMYTSNNDKPFALYASFGESNTSDSPLLPRFNTPVTITQIAYPNKILEIYDNLGHTKIFTDYLGTPVGRKEQKGTSTYMNAINYAMIFAGDWDRAVYSFYIKRFKIELIEKEVSVFDDAYFYVPFKDNQSVTDIKHNISPSANVGSLTSDGYYTSGDNQYLEYSDSGLLNAVNGNTTIYTEFIPQELSRNQYMFDIAYRNSGHVISLFIYKTKNNKFGLTLNPSGGGSNYMDDEISNSSSVTYGNTYKICIKYNRSNGVLNCFINGAQYTYNNYTTSLNVNVVSIGRNSSNTTRFAKATYKSFAIWDKELTDAECIELTT